VPSRHSGAAPSQFFQPTADHQPPELDTRTSGSYEDDGKSSKSPTPLYAMHSLAGLLTYMGSTWVLCGGAPGKAPQGHNHAGAVEQRPRVLLCTYPLVMESEAPSSGAVPCEAQVRTTTSNPAKTEREGFEPSNEVNPRYAISSRAHSTALAPLHGPVSCSAAIERLRHAGLRR
jgi:hypothetical protein